MSEVSTKKFYFYKGAEPSVLQECCLLAGSANPAFADKVSKYLGKPLNNALVSRFHDGEVRIMVHDDVRDKDVFVIQSVCRNEEKHTSVNDALVELLLLISGCRRASAKRITAVIPYYGYARQDRQVIGEKGASPISAADVALMISAMGVDRVLALDLHCGQIQGFFPSTVPVLNLQAGPIGAAYFSEKRLTNPVVVSPDAGGVPRAKAFQKMLRLLGYPTAGLAMIVKQRMGASKIKAMDLVGDVKGCDVVLCDDMVDTAGTLCKAAAKLKESGALRVMAFCTHGLFSGPAADRIKASVIDELVVCTTVPLPNSFIKDFESETESVLRGKVKVLSLAPIVAETIKRMHTGKSIFDLYNALKRPSKL